MPDLLVFIPAWNEEGNLPGCWKAGAELPQADVLVVDDGSTDERPQWPGSRRGRDPLSREPRPAGGDCGRLGYAHEHGTPLRPGRRRRPASGCRAAAPDRRGASGPVRCGGRLEVPVRRRPRGIPLPPRRRPPVRDGRDATGDGDRPAAAVPRPDERHVRRERGGDGAARAPYTSGAPEVEALMRVSGAGLRLEEVPVQMRPRAHGESKLQGRKAVGARR